jgi:hypothetical protein
MPAQCLSACGPCEKVCQLCIDSHNAALDRSHREAVQAARLSRATAEWIISQALWRMYEHGKHGRPASAQCEVQHVTNLINGVVSL